MTLEIPTSCLWYSLPILYIAIANLLVLSYKKIVIEKIMNKTSKEDAIASGIILWIFWPIFLLLPLLSFGLFKFPFSWFKSYRQN